MASTRRLAAILAADVAGYSRLMGADEEGTHERLKAHRREFVDPKISDAVRCAAELQRAMIDRQACIPEDHRIRFRVGINLGDVIVEDGDIFGDGVNVAARSKPSQIPVASISLGWCDTRAAISWPTFSRTWGSGASRTLHGRCGSMHWGLKLLRVWQHRPHRPLCQFPSSSPLRGFPSRCCHLPISATTPTSSISPTALPRI
jgi:class 3 adenylate cyclase